MEIKTLPKSICMHIQVVFSFERTQTAHALLKKKTNKEKKIKKIQSVSIHFYPTIKLRKKQRLKCQLPGFLILWAKSYSV